MTVFRNIKGDLSGALSAAIIMLPMSIGYGIIAYSPLGTEFAPSAALLGIYSGVLCCITASLLGGTPIQISGPKAPLTLALGAVVSKLVFDSTEALSLPSDPSLIIGMASITVLIAGISQIIFGAAGLGNVVKYVPQPVVAGFMNGIAILLITRQIRPLIGIENNILILDILSNPNTVHYETFLAGVVTIISIFLAKRYIKIIPASVFGLVIGTIIFYFLASSGNTSALGQVIGPIKSGLPESFLLTQAGTGYASLPIQALLPHLIVSGLIIGLIGSMESLLSSVVSDNLTSKSHNSRKELIGQGAGNIVCAIAGALPGAGSIPRSIANYKAGGRTRLSGIFCGLIIFTLVMLFGPLIGKIPLSVIAGIIIVVGYTLFDRWSFNLIRKVFSKIEHRRAAMLNLSLTAVVMVITISVNLIAAVVVGIIIASALFILKLGKSIVRREYTADQFHSRKMRNRSDTDVLEKYGRLISVVELQGPLFFGSAENLAHKIDRLLTNSPAYFILDMKRVNEIDSTGARIIMRIKKRVESKKKYFLLSNLKENRPLWDFLEAMNVSPNLRVNRIFPDTDSALEWAEDHLLGRVAVDLKTPQEVPLSQVDILRNLSVADLSKISKDLIPLKYKKGEPVFQEGDRTRDLYFLKKGSVTVKIHLRGLNCDKRLYTYASGIVFGEIAFLDGGSRSAGIWAHEDCEILKLPYASFQRLRTQNPELATKLVINIALELGQRLRRISDQMRLLEDDRGNGCINQP